MIRLLVCVLLMPAMLPPSGVCVCHYLPAAPCSATTSGGELEQHFAEADGCTAEAVNQNHSRPTHGENPINHAPCGPEIKALVGSAQADPGHSLTGPGFVGSGVPFETAALPFSANEHAWPSTPPDQRRPLYLSLLTLRI
jgi:hypothetical protein